MARGYFRVSISADGLAGLGMSLRAAQLAFPAKVLAANAHVAFIVSVAAKQRAPKGVHEGGGNYVPIAESIRTTVTAKKISIKVGGARTPYARVTEFGGRIPRKGFKGLGRYGASWRRMRPEGSTTRVKKDAYMYPALNASKGDIRQVYEDMLQDISKIIRSG